MTEQPDQQDGRSDGVATRQPQTGDEDVSSQDDPSLAGIFGARSEDVPPRPTIQPGSPSVENAAFVVLGVLVALFLMYRVVAVLPS